tara:strand:+ start:127 stop:876 length:750 start_codon:yes stop_codon:yes gene_type:complete
MNELIKDYRRILAGLQVDRFNLDEDKYSGVFLPVPFDEYWAAKSKVMLVGRETAGWNTANCKNTIKRVAGLVEGITLDEVVSEATERYKKHLKCDGEKVVIKSRSRFMQYYFRLAKELDLDPRAIIYTNLYAWDYNKKSPRKRPADELDEVVSLSQQLLAAQITHLKPEYIIFAAGVSGVDSIIKGLCNEHLGGYETSTESVPRMLWQFKAAGATCFRIAHPRATHGHGEFRGGVIERIKKSISSGTSC